ncbi:flagellar hook-length control protein FliK [Maritalea porphyrae]|uniref:flagellar hook-length control protein FliK n=1 Tax=Maritalea porphyrae TaxID=880732 RepID=UPI0024E0D8D0|nr:flagellar hook-length control protein FliK [Maritalea porphyrae]
MQFGLSAAVSFPGFELAGDIKSDTGSINSGQPGEGSTGFEALLAALVAGNGNQKTELNIEELKLEGVTPETQEIIDALAGMAEALVPLANAFDNLQIPTSEQLDQARNALGKLVESINAHPNRPELTMKGPIGAFAAQLSQLRQAGIDAGKEGASDFAKVGNLMERLDKILSQMAGTAPQAQQNIGEKASLNIHQMIDRLNNLAEKLPTLPAQFEAQLKAQQPFGNSIVQAQTNQQPATANPFGNADLALEQKAGTQPGAQTQGALANGSETAKPGSPNAQQPNPQQQTAAATAAAPEGAEPDILAQLANLGQQQSAEAKKIDRSFAPSGSFADAAAAENADTSTPRMTFAQVTREAHLQTANAYPATQKATLTATATAPLPSDLDSVETGTEKLLAQHKIETFQQQTNHIEAAKAQAGQRQVNIPGVAFEIVRQFRAGMQRFEVRLDPPEMGRIDVRMEVEGNNVTARMVVERAETLDLLQRDARALERALQQAGLNAERANLQFSLKQDGQNSSPNFENGGRDNDGSKTANSDQQLEDETQLGTTTTYRGTAGPGGLNMWA